MCNYILFSFTTRERRQKLHFFSVSIVNKQQKTEQVLSENDKN